MAALKSHFSSPPPPRLLPGIPRSGTPEDHSVVVTLKDIAFLRGHASVVIVKHFALQRTDL